MKTKLPYLPHEHYRLYVIATDHFTAGRIEKCVNILNEILCDYLEVPELYEDLAECFWEKMDYEKMSKPLNRAIKLRVKNANAFYLKGAYYAMKGFDSRSLHCYKMAHRYCEKRNVDIIRRLGLAYFIAGEKLFSKYLLFNAHVLNPFYIETILDLCSVFVDEGNVQKAKQYWFKASRIDIKHESVIELGNSLKELIKKNS